VPSGTTVQVFKVLNGPLNTYSTWMLLSYSFFLFSIYSSTKACCTFICSTNRQSDTSLLTFFLCT